MSKKLGLLINSRNGRFTVHQSTLETLGMPDYVRFLIDAEQKIIVLLPCEENLSGSIMIPKPSNVALARYRCCFKRQLLMRKIFEMMGWEMGISYQAWGQFSEELGGVVFRLEEATRV